MAAKLKWEVVERKDDYKMLRAPVPGGWFVMVLDGDNKLGLTFYPDPNHSWVV